MIKGKVENIIFAEKHLNKDDELYMYPLYLATDQIEEKIKVGVNYTLYLLDDEKQRSLAANKYYWGVVLKIISDETGISTNDLHEYFKLKFNSGEIEIDGKIVVIGKDTKKMKQKEFMDEYVQEIREWSIDTLQCSIPLPQEVTDKNGDFKDLYITANHLKK